ncbi:hypothetical protein ACFYL6_06355 [Micromonospora sp. NPDC007208]|uniref:hypothetical protein n=1 Tax=Micromonospora sp. NPDC007208 TaxID=3364236 RepID=UPI0036A57715
MGALRYVLDVSVGGQRQIRLRCGAGHAELSRPRRMASTNRHPLADLGQFPFCANY